MATGLSEIPLHVFNGKDKIKKFILKLLGGLKLTFFLLSAGVDTEHIVRIWACVIPAVGTGLLLVSGARAWICQIPRLITSCSTNMVI